MHTVSPPASVTLSDQTPGTSASFEVVITGAPQPAPQSVSGTVAVEFNGEVATAPLTVNYAPANVLPALSVDFGTANLQATAGPAVATPGFSDRYTVQVTVTVV